MEKKRKKRVIVGMSSGVDSSVAAAILQKQGYAVVGVFIHFWKEPSQDSLTENKCCSLESLEDARKVCQVLGIPLYTANAEKEFKKEVVDYFLEEYSQGRTPNPCVACNEFIKFNVLWKKMLEMDGDFVASGHYALRREFPISNFLVSTRGDGTSSIRGGQFPIKSEEEKLQKIYRVYQGADKEKDQSYFLYNFNQEQLSRILFPVGEYKKPEIRKMAKEMGLPVFDKVDSQGLCFTAEKTPENFLRRNLKLEKGEIRNTDDKIVGGHEGLPLYTIGQRKGINIGGDGPYYVASKDLSRNVLIVTNDERNPALVCDAMEIERANWTVSQPELPCEVLVKTRYRHNAVSAIIESASGGAYRVRFAAPQRAIASGQSAVFYAQDGELIGGGRIK